MTRSSLQQQLTDATQDCLARSARLLADRGIAMPRPSIRFDLRGQAAGQFRQLRNGELQLRYNLPVAGAQPGAFLAETIPHEVAHLVVHLTHPKAKPHGPEWCAVMQHLGIAKPRRCHDFQLADTRPRVQRRWPYRCGCQEHQLSTTRHLRIVRGQCEYLCVLCEGKLTAA